MSNISISGVAKPGEIPNAEQLGFGKYFTDHMFVMDYAEGKGWHSPRIVPYDHFELYPAVGHYG